MSTLDINTRRRLDDLEAEVARLRSDHAVLSVLLGQSFDSLLKEWRADTEHLSSITDKVRHPAYIKIVSLGPPVIPYILREMEQRPGHWHSAMVKLTGTTPPSVAAAGTVSQGCAAWLAWAREHGHQW